MGIKKIKQNNNSEVSGFIHFLKNEFSGENLEKIKKVERKVVKSVKNETVIAKENFHKIGKLIDDALKHLPDADEIKDHDDRNADEWQKLHAEIKKEFVKPQVAQPKAEIISNSLKRESPQVNINHYDIKILVFAVILITVILANLYFCLKPDVLPKIIANSGKIISLERKTDNIAQVDKNPIPAQTENNLSQAQAVVAKALYIIRNKEKIEGKDSVGVSAKDLFGQNAGASAIAENEEKITVKKSRPEAVLEIIKISWINFFKEIF